MKQLLVILITMGLLIGIHPQRVHCQPVVAGAMMRNTPSDSMAPMSCCMPGKGMARCENALIMNMGRGLASCPHSGHNPHKNSHHGCRVVFAGSVMIGSVTSYQTFGFFALATTSAPLFAPLAIPVDAGRCMPGILHVGAVIPSARQPILTI